MIANRYRMNTQQVSWEKIKKIKKIERNPWILHHAMSLGQGVPKTMGPWPPTWGAHYFRSDLVQALPYMKALRLK
jgi:hypothetical protein